MKINILNKIAIFALCALVVAVSAIDADAQKRKRKSTSTTLTISGDTYTKINSGGVRMIAPTKIKGFETDMPFVISTINELAFEDANSTTFLSAAKKYNQHQRRSDCCEEWGVTVSPYISTDDFVTFRIESFCSEFRSSGDSEQFVTFIKGGYLREKGRKILSDDDVWATNLNNSQILSLINEVIDSHDVFGRADFVTNDYTINKDGITFLYGKFDIGANCMLNMDCHITVSYIKLKPFLKPEFYDFIMGSTIVKQKLLTNFEGGIQFDY